MAENNEKSKAGFGLSEVDAPRPVWLERWEERSSQLELEQSVSEHTYLDTWLNYKSAHYARHAYQWDYISDHLHARVLDHERIREYILMREQGESDKAYKERLCLSSYTPDFYRATVALASMIFGNDNNVTRTFERDGTTALGNPMDTDKPFGQFWADVDGMGTDYEAFIFNLAVNLVAYGEMWILLDGWKQVEGSTMKIPPRLKLIPPQHVLRETHGPAGTINSAKVLTFTEAGEGTQRDKPKYRGVYTVYHDKNWERWTHDERGKEQELISLTNYGGDGGGFYYQGRTKQPTPPIFRVRLPIDAPIGYTMARKANTLLNHESTKDFLLHIACFSKFCADVYTSDKRFDARSTTIRSQLLSRRGRPSFRAPGASLRRPQWRRRQASRRSSRACGRIFTRPSSNLTGIVRRKRPLQSRRRTSHRRHRLF